MTRRPNDRPKKGVKQIKKSDISARFVFIAPPSEDILEQRLRGRGTEDESSVQERLKQAKLELEYSKTQGVHDKIIVNDGTVLPFFLFLFFFFEGGKGGFCISCHLPSLP